MAARGCGRVGSGASAAGPGPRPVMRRGLCLARRRHQGIVSCPRCRTASRRPRATLRPSPPTPMPLHLLRFAPAAPDRQNSATQRRPDAGKERRPAKQRTRMYTKSNRPSTVPDARRPPTRRRKHWRFQRAPPPLVTAGLRPPRRRRHQPFIRRLVTWQRTVAWPRRCRHRAATSAIAPTPTPRASELSPCSTRLAVLESCSTLASTLTCNTASSAATCRAGPQPAPCSSRRARLRALFS